MRQELYLFLQRARRYKVRWQHWVGQGWHASVTIEACWQQWWELGCCGDNADESKSQVAWIDSQETDTIEGRRHGTIVIAREDRFKTTLHSSQAQRRTAGRGD